MKQLSLVGRVLFSLVFLAAAPGHFQAGTIAYAAAQGVPLASLAVPASGVLALLGALSVILGYRTRWGAAALVAFLVPVTFSMHAFWAVSDPMLRQLQMAMFMKNAALIGAALTLMASGAGAYSLDARAQARRGAPAGSVVGEAA